MSPYYKLQRGSSSEAAVATAKIRNTEITKAWFFSHGVAVADISIAEFSYHSME